MIMGTTEKTVKFKIAKETKNTVRYDEVPEEGQPPIIGTLSSSANSFPWKCWIDGDALGACLLPR